MGRVGSLLRGELSAQVGPGMPVLSGPVEAKHRPQRRAVALNGRAVESDLLLGRPDRCASSGPVCRGARLCPSPSVWRPGA
jgi:hypothetical protein